METAMKRMGQILAGIVLIGGVVSCASQPMNSVMSAKDEARFAAAIETGEGTGYEIIGEGEVLTMDESTGKLIVRSDSSREASDDASQEGIAERVSAEDEDKVYRLVVKSDDGRNFDVDTAAYEAFFGQSPAFVLSRMKLEPIQDGTHLLGYRIAEMAQPFEGVDLQVGDIVVGVDGVVPSTPDAYFEAWQKAKKTGKCVVNIQRGTERFALVWQAKG